MSLASPRVVNIKDLRRLARARLPDGVFDYLDGAADDEITLKDSERAFTEVLFKPRFAVATPSCDLGVTVLGQKLDLPFLLAPIGYSRLMHPRGELAASRAAGKHGTGYIHCIWPVGAVPRRARSPAPRRRATRGCSSPSTRRWPEIASATSATA
jgi:isopentenyl diphosphate isomerase/L-lactate dehydrogenase-like FMN-dependent dehydrogenase